MVKSLHSVDIVTASAGTGKTYRLTSMIEAATVDGSSKPETVLATTFTVKAAEELRERISGRLLQKGSAKQAIRLLGARIGTVNSVCGGLVGEYALALGLSPVADVISDETQVKIFRKAADAAISRHAEQVEEFARRLGQSEGQDPHDWRNDVNAIVAAARGNDMAPEQFTDFARRSKEGFARIVSPLAPGETAEDFDQALNAAITALLARYQSEEGLTKTTKGALEALREIARKKRIASFPWSDWARLAKLGGARADDLHFEPLRQAASAFPRHPRLVEDVGCYIDLVFACAGEAYLAYEDHKRQWGQVDFVDQERIALRLFNDPDLAASLIERIGTVYVDEFQDTSPLQLALFVALSQIASSSAWVGDPKQAIFGFRGADPELIARVAPKIQQATGGAGDTLGRNYRSRPGLVSFVNDAFGETFLAMGLPPKSTRVDEVERRDLDGQGTPLNVWHVRGKNVGLRASALANGLKEALDRGGDWSVEDDGAPRSLRAGDIAILCTTNKRALELAGALAGFGIKVALERDGLFGTLEARLAMAALRWCADQRDTLALAEMAHLLHAGEQQPAWFEASLDDDPEALVALVPMAADLRAIAKSGAHKTPLEIVDAVLTSGGVADAIRRWGTSADRLLNLEAIRGLVAAYQDERKQDRAPATVTDLCAWLTEQEGKQPASRASDAVTILTYHRAKGLEWPMVILTDLDKEPRNNPFGLHVMSDRTADEIDWRNPLADRWLRLWPWPFGAQKKDVFVDVAAQNAPEGREAARIEREERARLLYVGATRARDYLVLALNPTKKGWAWIDELTAHGGGVAVTIPTSGDDNMSVNGEEHAVGVRVLEPAEPAEIAASSRDFVSPPIVSPIYESLALRPSSVGGESGARIVEEIDLGERLAFAGSPDMASVGEAIHRFLAADDPEFAHDSRVELAQHLLDAWGVTGLDARDVVKMSDRFRAFVSNRWPSGVLRRETPISQRIGDRTLSGRIDVVVETENEIIIIDHKSFPGGRSQWQAQAEKYYGQLLCYAGALAAANGEKRALMALHLPISGEVLMIGHRPAS